MKNQFSGGGLTLLSMLLFAGCGKVGQSGSSKAAGHVQSSIFPPQPAIDTPPPPAWRDLPSPPEKPNFEKYIKEEGTMKNTLKEKE